MRPLAAIDARLVGYAAGIATYCVQLTRALAELDADEPYTILAGRRSPPSWTTANPRFLTVTLQTPPHHRLEHLALPVEMALRGVLPRVLHSTDHVAPVRGPWRSVVTVHDLAFLTLPETHTLASRAYYARCAASARQADRVLAVSECTARDVVRLLGVDPARIRVTPEAAGPAYAPRPRAALDDLAGRLGFQAARPYVLFVGTIEPRKNLPLLLEAMALLPKHLDRDVDLLVVGRRGEFSSPVDEALARLALGARVRFLGPLAADDVAVLYSHAAVFAFPSLYEGFGLPLLEAMACGAPVVASNAGPMPEVVGNAGILLPPENPRAWADALGQLISDPAARSSLVQRGHEQAARFSWRTTATLTRAAYLGAVEAPRPR